MLEKLLNEAIYKIYVRWYTPKAKLPKAKWGKKATAVFGEEKKRKTQKPTMRDLVIHREKLQQQTPYFWSKKTPIRMRCSQNKEKSRTCIKIMSLHSFSFQDHGRKMCINLALKELCFFFSFAKISTDKYIILIQIEKNRYFFHPERLHLILKPVKWYCIPTNVRHNT